jgi:PAS domain S-box-containing protein
MTRPAPPPPGPQIDTRRGVLGVVLLYASFATLWILLSDRVVEWLFKDAEAIMLASIFKGWFFVAVTSTLLYWLLRIRPVLLTAQPRPTRIRRVPLALLALLTATIVTLVVLTVWYGLREEKEKAYAQLLAISESKAREIWTWHKERLSDASWANKAPYLRNQWLSWRTEGNVAAGRALQAFLKSYVSDAAFPRMEIVDAQGHKVLDSNDPDLLPVNPESAPFVDPTLHLAVLRALTMGEPMRAGPWRDATGTLRLAFVGPLAGETAHPAALVLHIDPPEYLHPALTDWPLPQKSAEAFLFRQDNDQLLFLSELRHRKDAALQLRLPLVGGDHLSAQVLRGDVAPGVLIEGLDYRNVPTYGVAQRIGDTEWWLMTKQDRAELLQIALVRSAWMVLAGALALLAVGGALHLHNERLRLQDSAREIEELRRIEHALSESEAQYRLLAENSSDVVWLYDLVNQRFLYASPSIEDLLGYTVSETLKLSMRDVVSPDMYPVTVARIKARVEAFLAGDERARTQTLESVNLHRDGRHIPVEAVSTLLADERGQITRMLGVSRDISERKKSQAQLLQLSQAIEQSPASVIITGLDGNIEYVNQTFVATSGYQRHEVLGENPRMLRSGRTPPEVYASMWFTLTSGQPWHGEMINRHKSGREYVQSMNLAPVRDPQGQVTHYLAVQAGRDGAEGCRGQGAPAGLVQPAHRSAQPPPPAAGHPGRAGRPWPHPRAVRPAAAQPGPLPDRQRRAGPQRRRPAAEKGGRTPGRAAACRRPAGPLERRRIRHPAARRRRQQRKCQRVGPAPGPDPAGAAGPALRTGERGGAQDQLLRRHHPAAPGPERQPGRRAAPRRHRPAPRQGQRRRPDRLLRRVHGAAHQPPLPDRARPAPRPGRQ